ncbi:hypothetical protein [Streptomyces chartreusis]|uniref:hypothetical protein n=1 Tax=Streptomyces chartreusis TaxID=1969 RepID=UPI0033BD3290
MDFAFTVELLSGGQHLGVLTYSFTFNSFSNRTVGVLACDAEDTVAFREKGRMRAHGGRPSA